MSDDDLTPPSAAVLAGLQPGDRVEVLRDGHWIAATVEPWVLGKRLRADDGSQVLMLSGYESRMVGRVRPAQQGESS